MVAPSPVQLCQCPTALWRRTAPKTQPAPPLAQRAASPSHLITLMLSFPQDRPAKGPPTTTDCRQAERGTAQHQPERLWEAPQRPDGTPGVMADKAKGRAALGRAEGLRFVQPAALHAVTTSEYTE